jgi:hypothetical protein
MAFQRLKVAQVENNLSVVSAWWEGYLPITQFANVCSHQKINKIPAMDILCSKTTFFHPLTRMKASYPFFVTSFQLLFKFHIKSLISNAGIFD